MLKNDNRIYHVRSVMLDTLMVDHEKKKLEGLSTMIKAAFGVPVPSPSGSSPPQNALQHVMLDRSLRVQQFAAICSAPRYGCVVEELSLAGTMDAMTLAERQECWS